VPATAVSLNDEQRDVIAFAATYGLPPDFVERSTPTPRALYDEYARRMGPLIIVPDMLTTPGLPDPELYRALDLRTVVSASMFRDEHLIGTLSLLTLGEPRTFREDELALLRGLADQAALAIVNASLLDEAQRRLQRLGALRQIDTAISASLDLRLTLRIVLEQVATQLAVDSADVLLLNPHLQSLEFASGHGFRSKAIERSRVRLGQGYAGRAALERSLVGLPNLDEEEPDLARAPLLAGEDFHAYYAVPLLVKGQVKGVLEIFHRTALKPNAEWLSFLETLAGQAAIAIDNALLFDDLQHSNLKLITAYDTTIEGWSRALDLRDKETEGHTLRVTEMTMRLARAMGIGDEDLVNIRRGALLHDIGKMGIPDSILLKPGPLDDEEWAVMRQHPVYAHQLLSPIIYLRPALDIPYCHHEKWDGTGYPRGLKGEEIPLAARMFAVADVWDALRSDRPYRLAWPADKVIEHIRSLSGTHFDPQAVDVFLTTLAEVSALE
jgi:putative nucleotidyltransferase with HDIG domain